MAEYHNRIYKEVIPGTIIAWCSALTEPDNMIFLECDGVSIDMTIPTNERYRDLMDVLGGIYGGDGINSFSVPDYRGRYLRNVSTTYSVGYLQAEGLKSHGHEASSGPGYVSNTTNNSAYNVSKDTLFNTKREVGYSGSPIGANMESEIVPKTMYVRYYIGY